MAGARRSSKDPLAGALRALEDAGFKGAAIPVSRLDEMRSDYADLLDRGALSGRFYKEITSRYTLEWDFDTAPRLETARSAIITAAQQPKICLEFHSRGKKYYGIIPPTYVRDTDGAVREAISAHLAAHGYRIWDALLPGKLFAVRTGLARYGRNNIAYIKGWGSYFRLRAFFSDAPCSADVWRKPRALELCSRCKACMTNCPTKAIREEAFLIDGEKCLTFLNESAEGFPDWVDPAWHNCVIGCMLCQDVCPANKDHKNWLMPGAEFSDEETDLLLAAVAQEELPAATRDKLEKVAMLDSYEVLRRNLSSLIEKEKGVDK